VGMSDDVTIVNNTCYGNSTEIVSGSATNAIIKNNVFYTVTNLNYAKGLNLANAMSNYQIDNNIYYAPNKGGPLWFVANGVNIGGGGFDKWQTAGADVHGRYVDPLFISTDSSSPDFLKPSAASPVRGAGAAVPVYCDIAGTVRPAGQATDAGAWLYGSHSGVRSFAGARARLPTAGFTILGAHGFDLLGRTVPVPYYRTARSVAGMVIVGQAFKRTTVY
jgi:hypothetical protein